MAAVLPLFGEDATIGVTIGHLSGNGIYAAARLVVILARLAGPQHPISGIDSVETSNPASDEEGTAQMPARNSQPSQLTLAFQKPIERPPLLIRRLSSKSTTSGTSTPKQVDATGLACIASEIQAVTDIRQTSQPRFKDLQSGDDPTVVVAPSRPNVAPAPLSSPISGPHALPFRRPILRVKQSFASSATSGNTSTADSRSRNSAWLPEFIPEGADELSFKEDSSSHGPTNAPFIYSPNRIVSFGLRDEYAQQQVKTFLSQTRYRVRAAKPKFLQENLSANDSAIADDEGLPARMGDLPISTSMDLESEMVVLPTTPKRRYTARPTSAKLQPTTSPSPGRPARANPLMNPIPMSPIAFPGTPPRTPRNHSGMLPQSLAGSRRTSYASSIGESTTSRQSRQIVEVVVNGKRKANYVRRFLFLEQ